MFFGKGDTLEQWLRKKDPKGFKGWDGSTMRVYAVKTREQKQQEMLCILLVNDGDDRGILHRVYVTSPNNDKVVKGGSELWNKFREEYLSAVDFRLEEDLDSDD